MEGGLTELLWMEEEELRGLVVALATRLCQTENRMLMMAVEIEKAVEYGYRVGYEDGSTGQSYSISARDEESLVLH